MYDAMAIWVVECKFVVDSNFDLKHEGLSVGPHSLTASRSVPKSNSEEKKLF